MEREHRALIEIPRQVLDQINRYLTVEPRNQDECLDEDDTITYTAVFDNGFEMDIKCCGVQYNPDAEIGYGETNTAWSEAVLFNNGCEVASEYGEDDFESDWEIEYDGAVYVAQILAV